MSDDISDPKQLCEDCTTELVMVAKFLQKCNDSTVALDQLRRQIGKLNKSQQTPIQLDITVVDSKDDLYYENYDENVEYVIYDSPTHIIEETDTSIKSHETQQTNSINSDDEDRQTTDEVSLVITDLQDPSYSFRFNLISFNFSSHQHDLHQQKRCQSHRKK